MTHEPTPTQAKILDAVAASGPATAQHIAEITGLGYSTVTAQLRKLATAGLVQRQHDSTWTSVNRTAASHNAPDTAPTAQLAQPDATAAPDTEDNADSAAPANPVTTNEPVSSNDETDDEAGQQTADDDGPAPHPEEEATDAHPHADTADTDHTPTPDEVAVGADTQTANADGGVRSTADTDGAGPTDADGPSRGDAPREETVSPPTAALIESASPTDSNAEATDTEDAPDAARPTARRHYNKSDKPKRAKGELYQEVRAYFLANPGEPLTPREIGKAIDASDGAVVNVCHKLVSAAEITEVTGGKVTFVYQPPKA